MRRFKQKNIILLTLGLCTPLFLTTSKVNAGSFGAEIFCTMRDGGNDHESSWDAAYTYIKKQKGGIFKVSPKQAAAQITESVIRDRENFSYCVEYLDALHPNRQLEKDLQKEKKKKKKKRKKKKKKKKEKQKKKQKKKKKKQKKKKKKKKKKNKKKEKKFLNQKEKRK